MINLIARWHTPELLDNESIPFDDIKQNMKELNSINALLGGHAISIAGLKSIIGSNVKNQQITICEIGCGGGDNLLALSAWCRKQNINARFIGIDIKPSCIEFAKSQCADLDAQWIVSNYLSVNFSLKKPDVIFSSLFCHHFTEYELVTMLQWMRHNAVKGFFINDLHRHTIAYYSIKLITQIFSRSYLVKNDAPLSVARGFIKKEWQQLFSKAGIQRYSLKWKWAFRHLITSRNG